MKKAKSNRNHRNKKTGTKKSQGFKNKKAYKLRFHKDKADLQETAVLDRLCPRCYDQVKWKLNYGKYKPLKQPRVCKHCGKKIITKPYRMYCPVCADKLGVCSKCGAPKPYHVDSKAKPGRRIAEKRIQLGLRLMKMMTERSRKTLLRKLEAGEIEFGVDRYHWTHGDKAEYNEITYKKKYRDDIEEMYGEGLGDDGFGDDGFGDDGGFGDFDGGVVGTNFGKKNEAEGAELGGTDNPGVKVQF